MKVAIVHDYLTKLGGAEKVLQVIHRMYPDAPIYTLLYDQTGTKDQFVDGYDIRPSKLQKLPGFIRKRSRLLLSKFPSAIESLDLSKFDVVISSSNSFAHGVVISPKTLHITYCYSPTRYLWDWSNQYLKENNIGFGSVGFYIRSLLSKLRVWDYGASKRTNEWVAISKTVANRIKKYYRRNSEVIYPPTEIDELLKNKLQPKDFYLIVSRLTQYKNIDLAISAFNELKLPLFIIGEGADEKRLRAMANNNIKFLGWVDDKICDKYWSECRAFLFPGEDDFGLAPVQAMAAGRPVVALRAGGATETVVEGITGEFFDQPTAIDLISAVKKLEKNYQSYNLTKCKDQARKFSEEVFVKNFSEFIEKKYKSFKHETK